jgi:membrane associated rhomboid family serine protease
MLLPIGSDQATVRRMPWVTLGVMAVCVVVFVLVEVFPGDEEAVTEAEVRAVEYHVGHPYLELDEQLKGYSYYALRQGADLEIQPPADADQLRIEQAELDRLTDGYLAARGRLPYWRWGLVPAEFEPSTLVTHTFLHGGLLHLIGNLFIFYLVGPAMEDVWGRPLFAVLYFSAGTVAALTFVADQPGLLEPLIGASGAIAGVMGAFAVRFWASRITFFYWFFFLRIYHGTFEAPAGFMLGLWAVGELAYATGLWAILSIADMGNIAFLAHVGGFVFGVAFAFLVRSLHFEERFVDPAQDRREIVHDASTVEEAMALAHGGRSTEAMNRLTEILNRDPTDADAAAALWNIAVTAEATQRATPVVLPAIESAVRAGDVGLTGQVWGDLVRRSPEVEVDPRLATRVAELLMREGLYGDVESTLRWLAGRVDSATPEGLLVRLARLADQLTIAAPFAALALERSDLSPGLRKELQSFSGFSA